MAWVYTYGGVTDYTDGTTTNGWQPHNFGYGGRITFTAAGTIDQLSAYCSKGSSGGTPDLKMALYDTSGNLVKDGGSASLTSSTQAWVDVTAFSSASVSATDYFILTSSSEEWTEYGYNSANDGSNSDAGYSAFPDDPATITAEEDTGRS